MSQTNMEWTHAKVRKLIDAYRTKPVLWDPEHSQYNNKFLKSIAWEDLARKMDVDKSEVRRKMENLLSQLRREKIKMRQRMMGEKAWQPSWYGYELMSFLHNRKFVKTSPEEELRNRIKQNRIEQNRSIEIPDTNSEKEDDTNDTIEQNDDSNSEVEEDDEPYVMVVCKDDPVNPLSDKPNSNTTNDEDTLSHSIFNTPPVKIKKMSVPNRRTSSSVRSFASAARVPNVPSWDENQLYANFIASKFRSYSVSTRNRLQHEISLLLYRADNSEFDNNK